jgi:hypothetical protein
MVRGTNPGGGEFFSTLPDRTWGLPSLLINGYPLFSGGKAARTWNWPSTPSSANVKERVGLYLCSHCGSSHSVLGWTFTVFANNTEQMPTLGILISFYPHTWVVFFIRCSIIRHTYHCLSYTHTIEMHHYLKVITSVEETLFSVWKKFNANEILLLLQI